MWPEARRRWVRLRYMATLYRFGLVVATPKRPAFVPTPFGVYANPYPAKSRGFGPFRGSRSPTTVERPSEVRPTSRRTTIKAEVGIGKRR